MCKTAFSQEFLEKLRYANRIEDIMSGYVTLKRSGSSLKCLCPFHSERTPSCTVYPDTDSFYCFGCGAGGDVINFIMRIENLSWPEAVKFLANRSGIPLPDDGYSGKNADAKRKRLLEINKEAAKFFYSVIRSPDGRKGLEYLAKRGLKPETIKKFGLGYAPDKWSALKDHMLSLGYYENELVEASLLGKSSQGRTYDFFKNRVMFPFFDLRGNVIAFGGRTLDPNDQRKYLNSRETMVFKKNKTLFSLNYAKDSAVKKKRLLLCEGNMDVISMHQAGFDNAVATCGTAITSEHARLMLQYCDEVVICYDSDEAGQKASKKAISILGAVGIKTRVIKMEGAKDPDEFIKKFGAARFEKLIDNSAGAIDFELSKAKAGLDISNPSERIDYINNCFSVLEEIQSPIEREVYIDKLAHETGVKSSVIEAEVEHRLARKKSGEQKKQWRRRVNETVAPRDEINPLAAKFPKAAKAEEGLISYLFLNPDRCGDIIERISPDEFVTDLNRRIFSSITEKILAGEDISLISLGSEFSSDEMGKISKIMAKRHILACDSASVDEYIDAIKKTSAGKAPDVLNDEELIRFMEDLKQESK